MRMRQHRTPALFSLSMIDVLCGGLGAMLLLMLLNHLEARRASDDLKISEEQRGTLARETEQLRGDKDRLAADVAALQDEKGRLSRTTADLARARTAEGQRAGVLQAKLERLEADLKANQALLAQAQADRLAIEKQLAAATTAKSTSDARIKMLQSDLDQSAAKLEALSSRLQLTEKDKEAAAMLATDQAKLREELKEAQQRATALEADVGRWRKEAEAAGVKVSSAEESGKKALLDAATLRKLLDDQQATSGRLRQELHQAANRFAGIDLAGKRIVILVDKSGSMASVEPQKAAPEKWPELCRTVSQVLRSLSEVEQFQVIVFSDQAEFLLGKPGEWLSYTKTSPADVEAALLRVDPKGNTNLYAAVEAAFRFKDRGLSSIYLFSDGLPNVGPGLPPNPPPDEAGQAAILGKHLRDTLRTRWNRDEPKVRIHGIGFFYDSPTLGAFLWALTRENGGSFVGMSKP